jgi:hypothetical protein
MTLRWPSSAGRDEKGDDDEQTLHSSLPLSRIAKLWGQMSAIP